MRVAAPHEPVSYRWAAASGHAYDGVVFSLPPWRGHPRWEIAPGDELHVRLANGQLVIVTPKERP